MNDAKSDWIKIRATPDEKVGFEQAAEIAGLSLSAWVRERLRDAARRELEQARREIPFLPNSEVDHG